VRVGIVILPEQRWADARKRWTRAEEYGFAHAWTYDHLAWRDLADGPWFDAIVTLTAAAGATSSIRLGTLVASPNFRHPVHFAREITALDDVSGGRLTLGVGAGAAAPSFDALVLGGRELSPGERVDRFAEFVELLDLLLREQRVTWRGSYYEAVDARTTPGCVQSPRVPFVVAANGRRSMGLAERFGEGWITMGGRAEDLESWWRSVADRAARFEGSGDRYLMLDSAPRFSLSSREFFEEQVGRAAELGFTDVITHWPRPSSWYEGDEAVLEEVATHVLPHLRDDAGRISSGP
jgi:alkanesulfonate monooxygenase SsuD/methylene tetrahydromethanopterin reductase-like flavin-dependent oxidoreductase (luciferase family)